MIIYYQTDKRWANKIYSATAPHTETIKSSGCGVTSAAMILSNLTNKKITPDVMADYSVKNGFRIDGVGTAFALFPAIAKKYNLNYTESGNIEDAINCVKSGGMVVCSTNGGVAGLFSTDGHLFVMCGAEGETCIFADPYLYDGKYNLSFRKNKARVIGGLVYVDKKDAKTHITTYFCFSKKKKLLESGNDIVWELMNGKLKVEITDVKKAVRDVDEAKEKDSSAYWILRKIVNGEDNNG